LESVCIRTGQQFYFGEEQKVLFEDLKSKLIADEIMTYQSDQGLYILDVNAISTGIEQYCKISQTECERSVIAARKSLTWL